ncbi:MAG: tripartite tricarboxylate transporter TctB family protein [Sphaerochaetaceae bacterium]|nr:tripartite tricarboxylate transporter TctB family protein [Sphaerochaetaceae bacterium]
MKKLKVKMLPLVMTVLSALYFIYVFASEETAMNADSVGGDPGGKFLPYVMAVFMFFGFLYITLKERPDGKKTDAGDRNLFLITLCEGVLYIAFSKVAGFLILTVILLYSLIYLYTTIGEKRSAKQACAGGAVTLSVTVAVYFLFRYVSKLLMRLGRQGILPMFKSSTAAAVVALVIVAGFTVLLSLTVCRKLKAKGFNRVADAGIVTFATVLFLYIVFKQFFLVALAPGFINY